ncbi:MAG: hypothetical protein ABI967_01325 [bacterium]
MCGSTAARADFYDYATGGWLAANPIPAAFPTWGVDSVLSEQNRDLLREILEAAAKTNAKPAMRWCVPRRTAVRSGKVNFTNTDEETS